MIAVPAVRAQQIDFQRDIQPILAEKCLHCHGVDEATREAGLRLDDRDAALAGGDSGGAIVPGKASESLLIARVTSTDPDMVMPPLKEQKKLTAAEQQLLKDWIDQGAKFAPHWAFTPPAKAPLPASSTDQPVDAWILKGWKEQQLTGSRPAPSEVLCRRLYLDLIGLPPTPGEVEEYQRVGHAATVDALLSSPRYGEKWARHWLDVARYSDTNGYEKDLQREQWIWRDWVIKALNNDMPYDRFIVEQIAGDLLPGATQDQVIASGFLRNSMINEEGAIVPEQFRMVEMFDRVDCIGKAVMGLTTQCAQCHSHKFDPLTHTEYYGMFAFLNNSYEAQSWVYSPEQQRLIDQLQASIDQQVVQAKKLVPDWQTAMQQWAEQLTAAQPDWQAIEFTEMASNSGLNHPTQLNDGSVLMLGHVSGDVFLIGSPELNGATGLRLEALTHGDLPFRGPGRSKTGTWSINELEVLVKTPESKEWQKLKLVGATADFSEPEAADKDNKRRSGPVAFLIDGSDATAWQGDRGRGVRNQASVAVVQFEKPLEAPAGTQLKIAMRTGDMLGCGRFSLTRSPAPTAPPAAHAAVLALQRPEAERTEAEQKAILFAWMASREDLKAQTAEIAAQWARTPNGFTSVLHMLERTGNAQRPTHRLDRGAWDQPLEEVAAHTPSVFHPFDESLPRNRLGFAKWLVDRRSPLAARVAVNRIWQSIFGEGLVETAEDFGTRAPLPEHPELLDWLAVEMMEHGWSQKHIVSLIVNSETYKQDSRITPEALEKDPRNRYLARGPRFRADAEVIRDMAMSVSGLITHKLGGPSVIPPVPQNVLDYNYTYPSYWKPATGPERYRRTLYGFRKRSMPDPVMSNFDAPNGDFACARRVRSNTPLAALTGLNEPIFYECAQAFALRILQEGGSDDRSRADFAFQLCTNRQPQLQERDELLKLLQSRRERLADGWLNPREIATGDPAKLPELPSGATPQDAAAWTLVARVLLNLDETITKN
ncbi:MAG: PSD1 and planctomycete cytochrome C domain-containing protein [Aureliella sp.]